MDNNKTDSLDNSRIITNEPKDQEEEKTESIDLEKPESKWPIVFWSVMLFALVFANAYFLSPNLKNSASVIGVNIDQADNGLQQAKDFPKVEILGRSGYVWDVETNTVLFQKNAKEQLPLASITKVMAAIVALDRVPPLTTVEITPESLEIEGNHGLVSGEKWSLRDLIKYSLTISSNNGMNAIASAIGTFEGGRAVEGDKSLNFVDLMNDYAVKIGLYNTKFFNETGLDLNTNISGSYSSAEDSAKLLYYAVKVQPEVFESTTKPSFESISLSNIKHLAINTNEIIGKINGLIGSKTGFTDLAGGNLVIAFDLDINRPIIVSVLGSTRAGRFEDVYKLVEATRKYYKK